MRVKVKLVVFRHPEPAEWGTFCSYCPELKYFFGRGNAKNDVLENVTAYLLRMLCYRNKQSNLKELGWEVSENSVKVPIFTDEESVKLTEKSYGIKITEPQIVEIDVEVPIVTTRS